MQRLVVIAAIVGAAIIRFWGLNELGFGNLYYAAAVRSMGMSFANFFFAAFDPAGYVAVDKPPLASRMS